MVRRQAPGANACGVFGRGSESDGPGEGEPALGKAPLIANGVRSAS